MNLKGLNRIGGILGLIAAGAATTACQPLTNSTAAACILAITADAGASGQRPLSNTAYVAQSFLPQGAESTTTLSVSSVALKLITASTNNTNVSGTIFVAIEADQSTSTTTTVPTSPNGIALAVGTLDAATVNLNQPLYYTIPLSSTVTSNAGTVYWVGAFASYSSGGTSFVAWRGTPVSAYAQGSVSTSTGGLTWASAAGSMDLQIGCQ